MIGSRLRVPMYTPRLPGAGGGGGGVFQPAGGTPYKPNRLAETIGGLGGLYGSYLQGSEVGRKRRMEEELFPLEKALLRARSKYYEQPRGTAYPESYQQDLATAINALNTGEYDVFQVFRSMAQRYPAQSAELRRIILAEEPASDLEAWLQMQPEFQKQWDETKPQKKQFQLPGATPFGITPLPGARPGAPTPLPGAKYPAPTKEEYARLREEKPFLEGQRSIADLESGFISKGPKKVRPGLEVLAEKAPARGEIDVFGKLMRTPKEGLGKARPTPEEPTLMDISSFLEGLSAQERLRIYTEAAKLKPIWNELTKEEKITVYNLLAQGKTADELIKFYREQTKQ